MAVRKEIIATGEMYHVFNRSIDKQKIFKNKYDYTRMMELIRYYRFGKTPLRYSHFVRLKHDQKEMIYENLEKKKNQLVEIHAFCIMPNHFHFLLKPLVDNGLSTYINLIQHSYAKYFNTKYHRKGVVFQGSFKVVHIEDEEQFVHVHRYIHLNPVTAFLINMHDLDNYQWSSYPQMSTSISHDNYIINDVIMSNFTSLEAYKKFLDDQVDYQRKLNILKKLLD